ncbi:hypothetical protein COBT_000203 [Conglomerata obtusa]
MKQDKKKELENEVEEAMHETRSAHGTSSSPGDVQTSVSDKVGCGTSSSHGPESSLSEDNIEYEKKNFKRMRYEEKEKKILVDEERVKCDIFENETKVSSLDGINATLGNTLLKSKNTILVNYDNRYLQEKRFDNENGRETENFGNKNVVENKSIKVCSGNDEHRAESENMMEKKDRKNIIVSSVNTSPIDNKYFGLKIIKNIKNKKNAPEFIFKICKGSEKLNKSMDDIGKNEIISNYKDDEFKLNTRDITNQQTHYTSSKSRDSVSPRKTSLKKKISLTDNLQLKKIKINQRNFIGPETAKTRALNLLDNELNVLKQEIKLSKLFACKPRPIQDFEGAFFKQKINFYSPVFIDNLPKGDDKAILKLAIQNLHDFYISAKNLPLLNILKHSKKHVTTDEWVIAKEEKKFVNKLRSYEKYKEKGLFKNIKNMCNIDQTKEKETISNNFKDEVMKITNKNIIYEDSETKIFDNLEIYYSKETKNIVKKEKKGTTNKRYIETYDMMKSVKTRVSYTFPSTKKGVTNIHSSHLTILTKVLPELSRLQTPIAIIEYKDRNKTRSGAQRANVPSRDFRSALSGNYNFGMKHEDRYKR